VLICDGDIHRIMNIAYIPEDNPLFDRKIERVTTWLKPDCKKLLQKISKTNERAIAEYIISTQTEINQSSIPLVIGPYLDKSTTKIH
jgi:hypothetical protein